MSEFRSRVLAPLAVPVLGLLGLAVFVFAFSRVLLAVPKYWSVSLAGLLAAEILGIAAVLAAVRVVSGTQRVLVGILGVIVLAGGGVGLASGIRPIEHHSTAVEIAAENLAFDVSELEVPADEVFDLAFANNDANIPHNVSFYEDDTATASIFVGEIFNGIATKVYEVPALAAGDYFFRCDVHPDMAGTATAGGEGGHGEGEGEPAGDPDITVTSTGLVFDADTITAPADSPYVIEFVNQDANIPHNIAIYTDETYTEDIFVGEIFNGVATELYSFTTPPVGTYAFRCDLHPSMKGTFVTE